MPLSIETVSAQHIGDRGEQQDRVAIFPHPAHKGALLAVLADGMGGHSGGALAAEQVIFKARHAFDVAPPNVANVRETLAAGINDAHDSIRLAAMTSEQDPHSTACILILQPGRVDWAHCGDSRIYHFRKGEKVSRSFDHSYVMDLVRQGLISEEDAEKHPNKNVLLSCLGDDPAPRIDYGETSPLQDGDAFLLCSDGLWAYFTDEVLGKVLNEFPVRQAAEILINTARDRGKPRGDNISLAIVRIKDVVPEKKLMPHQMVKKPGMPGAKP
ncbi:MAG: protein phosphatase 2C domain-containing protein [Gammaproteobacteria bacterium]|nr:protein phosphatase 2C domain-containing protein [Gammaproteobacteria bacterium]MBU1646049.1 protein phosphatase 2C domain-containing protein [Gammaproteobacteria bacterium]MBU1972111.1 protein phosphatase 2C domain-containing protein [Gammaproteobacteria bacterium]